MDDQAVIIAVLSGLSRLQLRLHAKLAEARRMPNGVIWGGRDPRWTVGELSPPSPWLDVANPGEPLYNLLQRIALVQVHLLGMLESGKIDGRRACVALQHLSGNQGRWSQVVLRLARQFDVKLAIGPRDETNGSSLLDQPLPTQPRRGA